MRTVDPFGTFQTLSGDWGAVGFYRLATLAKQPGVDLDRLPFTVKVLLENVLRRCDGRQATEQDVLGLACWDGKGSASEFSFLPARVLLQDFTGVPAVVDLAAMRAAMARAGGDPRRVNPLVPADLVIDHSVQVDFFGSARAFDANVDLEYARNSERYALLRWAQEAFQNFRVVPPGMGIVHQVNLEYLASVVATRETASGRVALPDTLVGTDSHTTMVNGLGVLGWGVGGIEAEAVLLGQPLYLQPPTVVGLRLAGELPEGATATDLVLTATALLRAHGVVEKFVEFYGPGLSQLTLPDRATLANMAPEYGATAGFFPVDDETLRYLRDTGRDPAAVQLVERYTKEQGMFRTEGAAEPYFSETLELDLSSIEPSLAGPGRPQDRVALGSLGRSFRAAYPKQFSQAEKGNGAGPAPIEVDLGGTRVSLGHGSVAIAAITSCTNTSNPSVMIGAGLLAKKAVERGLGVHPGVKTSLAPGSRAVTDYLGRAGLLPYLEALRFHVVGYGCTTCIGNSGALPPAVARAASEHDLVLAAVLSGNRNFEGRIHPQVRASYLASPPLVVAFALAGTVDIDLAHDPVGNDPNGEPVYLRDIWPSNEEIRDTIARTLEPGLFRANRGRLTAGDERWHGLTVPAGDLYGWEAASTYLQEAPFFTAMSAEPPPLTDIVAARVLAVLGNSVTTDHISPAGAIPADSPAGRYLVAHGVAPVDFNSYGARRGNHEVMMRGTFGNIRLRNALAPGREGDWTVHMPSGEELRIYDAATRYRDEGVPLLVIAGKEYGSGSSRDWAAKGPQLLGVRAVIAESYERIHRSNLVGLGVLPLEFQRGESAAALGLNGSEVYDVSGIAAGLTPGQQLAVRAQRADGGEVRFRAVARIDSGMEADYYRNGGVLQTVLRATMRNTQSKLPLGKGEGTGRGTSIGA